MIVVDHPTDHLTVSALLAAVPHLKDEVTLGMGITSMVGVVVVDTEAVGVVKTMVTTLTIMIVPSDPRQDKRWPSHIFRTDDELRALRVEKRCFCCKRVGHAWYRCPEHVLHKGGPNGHSPR